MAESIIEKLSSDVKKVLVEIITKKTDDEIMEYLNKALSEKESNEEEIDIPASENRKPYDERIFRSVKLQDGTIIAKMLSSQPEETKRKIAESNMCNFHKKISIDYDEWKSFLTKMNIPFSVRISPVVDWEDNPFDGESCILCLDIGLITTDLNTYNKTPEYQKVYADNKSTGFISILFNEDGTFRSFVF